MSFRKDDYESVLRELGPAVPAMFREALDDGFWAYGKSREKDPGAYPAYSACTRGNMLYDRIAASVRSLVEKAKELPLWWRITSNKRATDVFMDNRFAFRIKRTKENRKGLTTSVSTRRQRRIKSGALSPIPSRGQLVLPYENVADTDRTWITIGFDLDDLEEQLERVAIGVEVYGRFLWKEPLPPADTGVIAKISPVLARTILNGRRRRSA